MPMLVLTLEARYHKRRWQGSETGYLRDIKLNSAAEQTLVLGCSSVIILSSYSYWIGVLFTVYTILRQTL
ncbi:hypothetical protein ACJX0J_027367, partial [Zea mays]